MYRQKITLLKNWNNYYNRKLKVATAKYLTFDTREYLFYASDNYNVNTNDGVNCSCIINLDENTTLNNTTYPDYCILNEMDDEGTITFSYWFVMDFIKIRGTQYRVDLRRDLLCEYQDAILSAPCFIEKGYCGRSNPLIYNTEGLSFNRIKEREYPLQADNEYEGGWIVGYMARNETNNEGASTPYSINVSSDAYYPQGVNLLYENLPDKIKNAISNGKTIAAFDNYNYIVRLNYDSYFKGFPYTGSYRTIIDFRQLDTKREIISEETNETNIAESNTRISEHYKVGDWLGSDSYELPRFKELLLDSLDISLIEASFYDDFFDVPSQMIMDSNSLMEYDQKVYKDGDKYFRITITPVEETQTFLLNVSNANALQNEFSNIVNVAINNDYITQKNNEAVTGIVGIVLPRYRVNIVTVAGPSIKATIPSSRAKLIDAPYDMFMIPYKQFDFYDKNSNLIETDGTMNLSVASAISEALGSRLIDMQLLPYSIVESIYSSPRMNLVNSTLREDIDYTFFKKSEDDSIVGIMFFPNKSKREFKIRNIDYIKSDFTETDPIEIKVLNETSMTRIVSPNYNGIYEFSLQKNGGYVDHFDVMLDYKPYQPFIRVQIAYGGINAYSPILDMDVADARGLVCGGDFSLAQMTSARTEYQITNKTYQEMFDRDIKNLEVGQSIEREKFYYQQAMAIPSSIVGGTIGGAIGGAKFGVGGAVAGAIGGAAVGTVGSVLGYHFGEKWMETAQKEQKDYLVDKFNFSLQNVQAIPYSLTKVSAINPLNKIVPTIEEYRATKEEEDALREKLKYEGFTIMRIGKLVDYTNPNGETYLKGRIIRLEDLIIDGENKTIDTYIANEIYNEVNKGFYIDINGYSNWNYFKTNYGGGI